MNEPLDMHTLAGLLQAEERRAVNFRDSTLAGEQEAAIDYYEAQPFGDEEDGRSQLVLPDVAETIDYMTISILRTCVSGDRVVEFEAHSEGQEEAASEATEAIGQLFMRAQDGYKVLTDWVQSGLIEKIGVIKTTVIEEEDTTIAHDIVHPDVLSAAMEGGADIRSATELPDGSFHVEYRHTTKKSKYVDLPIPSEEFLFSPRCRDENSGFYMAHRVRKTTSDLIQMGFDPELVERLDSADTPSRFDGRAVARWNDETIRTDSNLPGMREVTLFEEYVRLDVDGDGIAELVKVFRVGREILDIEQVDENPFVVFTPFPRAHRMVGNSLADKVMDLQRVRSVVLRQTMDGLYLANSPRMWVPNECTTDTTIDDLLTVRPGGLVRGSGRGGRPEPLYMAFQPQNGMNMLEFFTGERESRTGITRLNQGLDADALNKTATGTALMQAQGQQMEEYIARNFAEAMSRLFRKKLRLMIRNGDPIAIKIGGTFRTVDPGNWSPEMNVSIRVGLGSGRKDQRMNYRNQLLQIQQVGFQAGMVTPENIWNNVAGLVRDAALGEPSDYWLDPASPEAKQIEEQKAQNQPPPDPHTIRAQAQTQIAQTKAAVDLHKANTAAQMDAVKLQSQEAQTLAKLQQQQDQSQREIDAENYRTEVEGMVALHGNATRAYRPGGSLDA